MKKGQFFIMSMILIALSITLLVLHLSIPTQLRYPDFSYEKRSMNDISFIRDTLKSSEEFFQNLWDLHYNEASEIIITNENNSGINNIITARFNLPDNAKTDSLMLLKEDGTLLRAGYLFDNLGNKEGELFLSDDFKPPGSRKYVLLSNSLGSLSPILTMDPAILTIETETSITIQTSLYTALLNKDEGGAITSLNINGEGNILKELQTRLVCGNNYNNQSSAQNTKFSVEKQDLLTIVTINGQRVSGDSYITKEVFLPDRIIFIEDTIINPFVNCEKYELLIELNKAELPNYLDASSNNYIPVPAQGDTEISTGNWIEFYDTLNSLGIIPNTSFNKKLLSSTSDETSFKMRLLDQSAPINGGSYKIRTTIVPLYKNRTSEFYKVYNSKMEVSSYEYKLEDKFNLLMNTSKRLFIQKGIDFLPLYKTGILFEERNNNSLNWEVERPYRIKFATKGGVSSKSPVTAKIVFPKDIDPASIVLSGSEGLIPFQVSTDNYYNHSYTNTHKNTIELNNSFLLFSYGSFDVSFSKSAGELSASIYSPANELINYNDINNNEKISVNTAKAGFFKMILNGTAGTFSFNTTSSKVIALTPTFISGPGELHFKTNSSTARFEITLTPGGSLNAVLYDKGGNTLHTFTSSETFVGVNELLKDYATFKLSITQNTGGVKIDAKNITGFSQSKSMLIDPLMPELNLIFTERTGVKAGEFFCFYNTSSNMDIPSYEGVNVSTSDFEVNNSFYSFDFDELEFREANELNNWFYSGWESCIDSSCSTNFNELRFYEKGPVRAVVFARTSKGIDYIFEIWDKVPIIRVTALYNNFFSFGPDFRTGGLIDTQYVLNEEFFNLNTDRMIDKHELTNSWISKGNANNTVSVILDKTKLAWNNTCLINSNKILIRTNMPTTVDYVINREPGDFLSKPRTSDHQLIINYTARSFSFEVKEELS